MPVLSVVVTVVEGDPALTRCLEALSMQTGAPDMEVIVAYDDAIPEVSELATRFPGVRFLDTGAISQGMCRNAFAEHALYERRRAAGLRAATGRLVGMLEDRGWPRSNWATAVIELHDRTAFAAIGGVVEHGGRGALRWALFFCDFGRYQPRVREGDAEYLTDVNICYKREALEAVRDLWHESYQESTVNWGLRRRGYGLHLSQAPVVVEQRATVRLWHVIQERVHWARSFAHVRGREAGSPLTCVIWATATPILPLLLFVRHLQRQLRTRQHIPEFVRAIPATLTLLHSWSLGECIGYCEAARSLRQPSRPSNSEHARKC